MFSTHPPMAERIARLEQMASPVKTILNIIWLILCGFWMFLGYLLAGVLLCITIIGIPFGVAAFRIGVCALAVQRPVIDRRPRAPVRDRLQHRPDPPLELRSRPSATGTSNRVRTPREVRLQLPGDLCERRGGVPPAVLDDRATLLAGHGQRTQPDAPADSGCSAGPADSNCSARPRPYRVRPPPPSPRRPAATRPTGSPPARTPSSSCLLTSPVRTASLRPSAHHHRRYSDIASARAQHGRTGPAPAQPHGPETRRGTPSRSASAVCPVACGSRLP
ncbi:hypothetical protein SBADM41S_10682 [Streptomyces badius]